MPEPMSVKRYDLVQCDGESGRCCADLVIGLHDGEGDWVEYTAYAALLANNERLQGLLAKYGNHKPDCECITPLTAGYGTKCTCGFTVALRGKEEHNV